MHLLLPLDLRLLSFRFSRSLLLAACLLNTFVVSLSCDLQVEKWETTGDGTLSVCLSFGPPVAKSACSPPWSSAAYSSAVASSSADSQWYQVGHPASLGSLYFPTLDYINKVISASLGRLGALGQNTPWDWNDSFITFLSTSLSDPENPRAGYLVTNEMMGRWEATLFFNPIIEFQVSEHRLKDHHRTGGVELHVGHEVQQFHPFLGRPSIQTHHLLASFVHFRNTDAMKKAFSNTQILYSKLGRDLPLPDWFHDLPLKPENLQTPPDYALPWLKLRAFILLMLEQDGGWTHHTGIKAITQATLEEFEGVMKNRLIPLLKRKNNQKDWYVKNSAATNEGSTSETSQSGGIGRGQRSGGSSRSH
ncbi:hypothetical protein FB446DRAFT_460663 [Lentinula raphanica]|nr:hypothetical protein FB446DRAFT_460663 [Lentinula raphanica]